MEKRRLLSMTLALALPLAPLGCTSPTGGSTASKSTSSAFGPGTATASKSADPSWTDKLSNSAKMTRDKAVSTFKSDKKAAPSVSKDDPVALSSKPVKPGADLYISMGQAAEKTGKADEAEKQYEAALKAAPDDLDALLAVAHFRDRQGKFNEASKLYRRAIEKHPYESTAYNDLGLCFHRRGMLKESAELLSKAVELKPESKLYRNNLAAVLVDMSQPEQALVHLKKAHGEAIAHYNMGFMLQKKGDIGPALAHFERAAVIDPSLTAAQEWVARLAPHARQEAEALASRPTRPTITPVSTPVQSGTPQSAPAYRAPMQNTAPAMPSPTRTSQVTPNPTVDEQIQNVQYTFRDPAPTPPMSAPPAQSDLQIRTQAPPVQQVKTVASTPVPVTRLRVATDPVETVDATVR